MESVQERAKAAQALIVPILKDHFVDIGSEPFFENGRVLSRLVYLDEAPKEVVIEEKKDTVTEIKIESGSGEATTV